jgi:hypothetical protein
VIDMAKPSKTAVRETTGAPTRRRLRGLALVLSTLVGAVVLFMGVLYAAGASLGTASLALSLCAIALVYSLWTMYRVVRSVSIVDLGIDADTAVAGYAHSELREERRRLLRAINELKFDYEMGKLSEADYRAVREQYELRAVEVIRELEGDRELDPALVRELRKRGLASDLVGKRGETGIPQRKGTTEDGREPERDVEDVGASEQAGDRADDVEAQGATCSACGKPNDADARFCKHCGAGLSA